MRISLPADVNTILKTLESHGYESCVVGGSVRDSLLKRPIHDYDIATSANVKEIVSLFPHSKVMNDEHSTVLLFLNGNNYEVTPYRGNNPLSLKDDLSKRDFKIDALAYLNEEIYDPFNGLNDIKNRVISAVGNALDRFYEDPIRILRGLRLSGELGFTIEGKTKDAMKIVAPELKKAAGERIGEELKKILVLPDSAEIIRSNKEVFLTVLPELKPTVNFAQHSDYHEFDVFEHLLHSLKAVEPRTPVLCFASLFHDVEKPACFFMDEKGEGHFYGHDKKGEKTVRKICFRFHYSKEFTDEVCFLIHHHMFQIQYKKTLRRYLYKYGKEKVSQLLSLREADVKGTTSKYIKEVPYVTALRQSMNAMDLKKEGIRKDSLAVNGEDLIALGFRQGKELGDTLKLIHQQVVDEELPNDKKVLLNEAKKYLKS